MTNGNDLLEYEEQHHDELVEVFIKENIDKWNAFVEQSYADHKFRVI